MNCLIEKITNIVLFWIRKPSHRLISIFLLSFCITSTVIAGTASNDIARGKTTKVNDSLQLAEHYLKQGQSHKAMQLIDQLEPDMEQVTQPATLARYYSCYGRTLQNLNRYSQAAEIINHGLLKIERSANPIYTSSLLNDLGSIYSSSEHYQDAEKHFRAAYEIAQTTSDYLLIATTSINLTKALMLNNNSDFESLLPIAEEATNAIFDHEVRTNNYLALGSIYRQAYDDFNKPQKWRLASFRLFKAAKTHAVANNDKRLLSYAYGYTGQLYEDEKRFEDALHYSRKATFAAQEANAAESLYQWEWQTARILRELGATADAIVSYKQAISTLSSIRADLTKGSKNTFQQIVGPIYYEFTDLLLSHSVTLTSEAELQSILDEIKNSIEQLKAAEIEDYFDNECVLQNNNTLLSDIEHRSAVIYPIIMKDRLEIIVNIDDVYYQKTTNIASTQLTREIRILRENIENFNSGDKYLSSAQNIYTWIIKPIEAIIKEHNVKTLVFIPDGSLRTIPMSVLHDGKQFLIEKYALATTPGLNMTTSHDFKRDNVNVLVSGISESVQGYTALPSVEDEIKHISQLHHSKTFINNQFVHDNIDTEMKQGDYSIVHIATHGEFNRDHKKSYLLTYDDKLTLPMLEKLISQKKNSDDAIELLVLSACQTAKGDDRAALGLAGIALKAGAKSALATLWYISDDATSKLVSYFYNNLNDTTLTKSEALQLAQLSLINDTKYKHPGYWAAFMLIGNWL